LQKRRMQPSRPPSRRLLDANRGLVRTRSRRDGASATRSAATIDTAMLLVGRRVAKRSLSASSSAATHCICVSDRLLYAKIFSKTKQVLRRHPEIITAQPSRRRPQKRSRSHSSSPRVPPPPAHDAPLAAPARPGRQRDHDRVRGDGPLAMAPRLRELDGRSDGLSF
jgi:hypothetical protein